MAIGNQLTLLALTLCCALAPIGIAGADVMRVVVKSSGPMGLFKGRQYLWVTATMEGTVDRGGGDRGQYRVPIVLMYPDCDPNGFGFVDVVNSASFLVYKEWEAPRGQAQHILYRFELETRLFSFRANHRFAILSRSNSLISNCKRYYAGDLIFSDYLRREGFTYLAVQWARMVTYVLGVDYGVIEDGRDGYEIVKDAARFLRHPSQLEGAVPFRPAAVGRVIGFGQSQTAALLREVVRSGQNREKGGALSFDGILAGVGAGMCLTLNNDEMPRPEPGPTNPTFEKRVPCGEPLPEDGKFISIQAQSDMAKRTLALSRAT